jgi:putative FmdB family regulatory protein
MYIAWSAYLAVYWEFDHSRRKMPVYEFKCPVCSNVSPVKAEFDAEITAPGCPYCLITMERIWTANPIHFKGKGWGHQ